MSMASKHTQNFANQLMGVALHMLAGFRYTYIQFSEVGMALTVRKE